MQMIAAKPSRLTDQRLQRLTLWLALTVVWFASHVLAQVAPHAAARLLKQHAQTARLLLVARAVKRIGFRAPCRGVIPMEARPYTCRRVAGAVLRRALRKGASALCAVLAESERWIARIARSLRRGFTKLRRLPRPRPGDLPTFALALIAPLRAAADTS